MIAFVIIFQLPLSQGWSKDVTVVRAYPLPFYHCGPGSSAHDDAIFWLSLLLVLSFASRGFSPSTPAFVSPQKSIFPNSN